MTSSDFKLDEIEKSGISFEGNYPINTEEFDDIDNKERGYVGKTLIYEDEVYINTYTGEGYDLVVKKMQKFVDWYSGKIRLAGFDQDDIKQFMFVLMLDGIRRYNPRPPGTKTDIRLSTFLYIHVKNRIISRIKEETRQSLNATYNEQLYKFICPCKTSFVTTKEEAFKSVCGSCKKKVDDTWKIRAEHHEPISLDTLMSVNEDDGANDKASRIHYNGKKNNFIDFFGSLNEIEDIDRNIDFSNILCEEDDTTRKIAELMYNEDYSITDAAKEVGLTCWAASLRLKKLKNKKHIKDFFLSK